MMLAMTTSIDTPEIGPLTSAEVSGLVKNEAQNIVDVCDWAISHTFLNGPIEMYEKAVEARASAQATVDTLQTVLPESSSN